MGAGQPDWQKLHEMGKLPKEARGKISMLAQVDVAESRLEKIEKGVCKECHEKFFEEQAEQGSSVIESACEVEGCGFVAKGRSPAQNQHSLKLHLKTHEQREV